MLGFVVNFILGLLRETESTVDTRIGWAHTMSFISKNLYKIKWAKSNLNFLFRKELRIIIKDILT